MNYVSFLKQKTTIAGIATLLGTASAYMQGTVNLHDAITAAIVAVVLIVLPEEKAITPAEIGSMVTAAMGLAAAAEPPKVPAALVEAHQKAQTALVVAQTAALDAHTATLVPPAAPVDPAPSVSKPAA